MKLAVLRAIHTKKDVNKLRMKLSDYQSMTDRARTCLDRIECDKCIRFYAQNAFCDEQLCDVVDALNRSLYYDGNHISAYGAVKLQKLYLKLFNDMANSYT